ncbi:MAG: efflux transporter periplasmic adaptor subunit, partial [Rhodobacterales bacterium]
RQEDLKARGVGTDTAIEAAALAAAAANQAVLSRRQALQTAEARLTRAETRLIRQQINLSEAERNLADTSIYAGFSGTLSAVSAVQGGLVARNERLAQLVDATALEVSFRVSTRQYARLLGPDATLQPARVKVTMDLFGVDMVAQGNLSRESAVVGAGKTGRLLFARLDSASGFKPGDFVTVQIDEPRLEGVVLLPASAVDANQSVLLVGPEQRLRAQKVELLRTQGNDVIVSAAGVAGQQVVQMRSPLLGAGIKVKVQDAQNGAPAGPEMVSLTPERREELRAFVKANTKMPQAAKQRLLDQLEREKIPARMLRRLQSRMER